jgi:glycosyltransferase involved in cell wall biosynthesis
MPTVDVAIPCYQHGRYLRDCVASVLGQSGCDVRVLVIDNASPDGSADVARSLEREDDRVAVLVRERNLGPHASFNAAVDWASGDYLMILCADDLLAPGCLAGMVAILETHREAAFAYGLDVHWRTGRPKPELPAPSFVWRVEPGLDFIRARCRKPEAYIAAGMVLTRTGIHKSAGHYREELPHTDDFEMLLRLALLGPVAHASTVVGIKRMHNANRTTDFLRERTRDLAERLAATESFFARDGRELPERDALRTLARRSIAARAYWCALKDLARGRRSWFDLLRFAIGLDRSVILIPPVRYFFPHAFAGQDR